MAAPMVSSMRSVQHICVHCSNFTHINYMEIIPGDICTVSEDIKTLLTLCSALFKLFDVILGFYN